MSATDDAAEFAKAIREYILTNDEIADASRQIGSAYLSSIDFRTIDGRLFVVLVSASAIKRE